MTEQPSTAPADDRQGHSMVVIMPGDPNPTCIAMHISSPQHTHETGEVVAATEDIKVADPETGNISLNIKDFEVEPEQAMSETIYDNGDYSIEIIEGFVLKIEVSGQSSDILRSINGSKQILEADGEAKDQIYEEADLEGSISYGEIDDMIIGSSKVAKQFIEDLEGEFGGGSNAGTKASQKIDSQIVTASNKEVNTDEISVYYGVASEGEGSKILNPGVSNLPITGVSPDNTIVQELKETGSLRTQQHNVGNLPLAGVATDQL
ncbi:hypothetical protein K7X08_024435 [Anisodus acutangulus]|uniref:Uncharacterized protein n=1 Tax=Anisodus acutangulus TaxID=402998 RepID=A0A9Q1MBK6_9SOLA|nr:hypothetical protein K7X08_024435 [Anisodus acutangulus]